VHGLVCVKGESGEAQQGVGSLNRGWGVSTGGGESQQGVGRAHTGRYCAVQVGCLSALPVTLHKATLCGPT
jgi:hypothetical protein